MSSEPLAFFSEMRRFAPGPSTLVVLSAALFTPRATAQENETIAVDCPPLDTESRAALDARARAELLVRSAPGTFVVACRDGEARLSWHPLAATPVTAAVTLEPDARASVDRILEALGNLVTAGAAPVTALAPAAGTAASPQPEPPVAPPPAIARAAFPVVAEPPQAPTASYETARNAFDGILFGAGMDGELWSRTAALGPRATALVSLAKRFDAGAAATVFFTLRSPDDVSGRVVRVALRGAYAIDEGERFRAGADVFFDLVHATAPNAGSGNDAVFGASVRATAALVTHPVRVELGPTLAFHPKPVHAWIGPNPNGDSGNVAFELQRFTAGFVLEVVAGPY